jgi:DNA transformation protein
MTKSDEFLEYVKELFEDIDGIRYRKMFGGYGIYKHGVAFALIFRGALYFKVDDTNRKDYEEHGSQPFVFQTKTGTRTGKAHLELPPAILEDPDELSIWVEKSYHAARRAKAFKK